MGLHSTCSETQLVHGSRSYQSVETTAGARSQSTQQFWLSSAFCQFGHSYFSTYVYHHFTGIQNDEICPHLGWGKSPCLWAFDSSSYRYFSLCAIIYLVTWYMHPLCLFREGHHALLTFWSPWVDQVLSIMPITWMDWLACIHLAIENYGCWGKH